jgi:hypothetical protein
MSVRNRAAIAVVWVLSLITVAVWAQGTQVNPQSPPGEWKVITKDGQVLSGDRLGGVVTGENIGFRVSRDAKGQVFGRMVVKIEGQWKDATFDVGITR